MKMIQIFTISILTLGSVANLTAEELQLKDNTPTVTPKACNNKTQGCCSKMKQGGMKKSHMKKMEQRLENIEALLKELVELQKAQAAK